MSTTWPPFTGVLGYRIVSKHAPHVNVFKGTPDDTCVIYMYATAADAEVIRAQLPHPDNFEVREFVAIDTVKHRIPLRPADRITSVPSVVNRT